MITSFDDYCIHQTHEPVSQPSQSDRNFYDRYWFNGFDRDGAFLFEIGFGLYPNRRVMDGHFSVVIDGVQHSFHGSRRAPRERAETAVGPLSIEILQPLRRVRVRLAPNETGIECDLVFSARSVAAEEPRSQIHDDGRLILHTSRFTQFGCWQGHFTLHGQRQEVQAARTAGARDKSWGVRPVGEPEGGAPGLLNGEPGVYWVWAPLDFGDVCTQFNTFQGRDGETQQLGACLLPAYGDPAEIPFDETRLVEVHQAKHAIRWRAGTRRAAGATIELVEPGGTEHRITLEPVLDFLMKGIGYQHPEWGHGHWKGELKIGAESWRVAEQNPLDPACIHAHQLVRARMGERSGVGTLETIVFGRHAPSGFNGILDGAA